MRGTSMLSFYPTGQPGDACLHAFIFFQPTFESAAVCQALANTPLAPNPNKETDR